MMKIGSALINLSLLLLILLISMACEDDCEGEPEPDEMRIVTFNAGLAYPVIPYSTERAPLITNELADFPVDVMCVQEFWDQEHWNDLEQESEDSFPHSLRRQDEPGQSGSNCTNEEIEPLVECIEANCTGDAIDELAGCVMERCAASALTISDACFQCLYANIHLGEVDPIREVCVAQGEVNTEAGRGYAYDGSFGTGLLSAYEPETTDTLLLESTMTRRAVLYALLPDTPIGDVHLFCMHLTALLTLPYIDPEEMFDSYESEQAAQIDALLDFVDEKTSSGDQIILAGDFNTGPELDSIQPELPANYEALINAGYDNPYQEQEDVACTYCGDNLINAEYDSTIPSILIDHILIKSIDSNVHAQQIMDEPIELTVEGETIETAYSDHFGLMLTLSNH